MKKIELVEIDIDKQKQNDAHHFSLIYHITDTETGEVWEHKRRTPPPYIASMMQRILELETQLSEKG